MVNLMLITLLRHVFILARLYSLVAALGITIPVSVLLAGIPVAQLSLLLAFTPGALGILEGGWYVVLVIGGVAAADIAAFLLGQRVYSLAATSLIFLLSYLLFGARRLLWLDRLDGMIKGEIKSVGRD
jgi:uncharacterized membrane protein YbhN (UPF0104 family)